MNILGLGIDIVEISRIKKNMNNKLFINRAFTKYEIIKADTKNKVSYYSKRFAAKEAFVKALGTGFRDQINLNNIEIKNDKLGKPYINTNSKLNKIIEKIFKIKKYNVYLSISDEKNYAIANVIITK